MGLRRLLSRRSISLRSHLSLLVLVTSIPLLVFAGLTVYVLAQREQQTFERGAADRTRAVLTAVDTKLKSSITTLEALASLSHFDRDDLQAFYQEAADVLGSQPEWLSINLADPSGQLLMHLPRSSDLPLPSIRERRSFDQVLRTRKPAVGDMVQDSITQRQKFSVRVPIVRNGVIKYVLSAVVKPQAIYQLLLAQRLPSDWVGVVLDANGRFVARTIAPEEKLGQLASESLRAALDRTPEGWFEGETLEQVDVYAAYNRSSFSAWTVALGIPTRTVAGAFHGPVLYLSLFGAALLAVGVLLASWLGGKTAGSIESLVGLVTDLGAGKHSEPATEISASVTEVKDLKESFLTARRLIQERSEERDRLNDALHHDIVQRIRTEKFHLLQIATTRALTISEDLKSATPKVVQAVCELTDWDVGAIWEVDPGLGELKSIGIWQVPAINIPEFEAASSQLRIRCGVGLAGRVWASGKAVWIPDVTEDANFLRKAQAGKEGLHAGVCFPISLGAEVFGVIECFSREVREPDNEMLPALVNIGTQLGQFIEGKRAEQALADSVRRKDALYQFLDRCQQARSLEPIYHAAIDAILSALGCDRAAILLHDGAGVMRFVAWHKLSDFYRSVVESHSPWEPEVTNPQPVCVADAANAALDPPLKRLIADERIGALAFIPITLSGRVAGKLMIYYDQPHALDAIELQLSLTIARQLALGIERKRAEEEIAQLNKDLEKRVAQRTRELQQANAALLHDMEERRRLEEQLLQAQKMESIGTLAGGVAHDFNNLLNIIQAYASVLMEHGAHSNEIAESVTVIKETVGRGTALVQQLLTVARKSGGAVMEPVNLNSLLERILPLIRETFPKTIEVSCVLEPDLPPIMADRNQIEQALLNLAVNARDAMPQGGRLTFKTQSLDQTALRHLSDAVAGRYVGIEVSDMGVGIDQTIQDRIFEPFFTTKDTSQGTGLGLSVVYGIVKNHNGFLDLESKPMAGASFRLYFPVARAQADSKQRAQEAASAMPLMHGGGTVLIAEDETNMRHLLEKIFFRRGYKVLAAANGQAALDLYHEHKQAIDVVLLDMGLPKLSGRDVLRKLKSENSQLKVIVTSGYIEPATRSEIDRAGVKFLQKPYTPEDVFKTLGSLAEIAA